MNFINGLCCLVLIVSFAGCTNVNGGNQSNLQSYPIPSIEASWIREGEPIIYEGQKWFPVNDVEVLMDSEVYQIGEYKSVLIFVEKLETKPYKRLYTKFAKNKFRYFELRKND